MNFLCFIKGLRIKRNFINRAGSSGYPRGVIAEKEVEAYNASWLER